MISDSLDQYVQIINSSPDPIVIIQDKAYKYVNNPFFELFGYTQKDIDNGLSLFQIVQEKDREAVGVLNRKLMNGEKLPKTFRIDLLTKKGVMIHCETAASIIKYNGRNANLVIICDIGDRSYRWRRFKKKISGNQLYNVMYFF